MKTETILNILDVAKDKIAMSEKDVATIEMAKLEITTLAAETKRLREALERIENPASGDLSPAWSIARAALKGGAQ